MESLAWLLPRFLVVIWCRAPHALSRARTLSVSVAPAQEEHTVGTR